MGLPRLAYQLVVAVSRDWGIGKNGSMPWHLKGDLQYFHQLTSKTNGPGRCNAVIMGRKTWESIPDAMRPLKGRLNVVLSRGAGPCALTSGAAADENRPFDANVQRHTSACAPGLKPGTGAGSVLWMRSLEEALMLLDTLAHVEHVFVIGGGQVYAEALESERCSAVHVTHIDASPECDTFFPRLDVPGPRIPWRVWASSQPQREDGTRYQFVCYTRQPAAGKGEAGAAMEPGTVALPPGVPYTHAENQYLDLVKELIAEGVQRGDRTGTGTLSKFGVQMRWDLRRNFPLLTTKRVFWRGVVEELLWFIRGSTDARELQDRGVHIWDGNSSRAFLDASGLGHREEGDLGPVYGFQWRHFGAAYSNMHADYSGQGVDQLARVVHAIKHNPEDRRIILSAWNPTALHDMALPPCHMMCQFYVADGELSCQMYQRSADVGLGVPFNIASYALLTAMLAQVCGLRCGELVHVLGDAHVYSSHVHPLQVQLANQPRHFPRLVINPAKTSIDSFEASDFLLDGYQPHKKIEMTMAV